MDEVAGVSDRQRPLGLDHLRQVEPFDVLHRQHEALAEPEGRMGGDDVGVMQLGGRPDLAEEAVGDSGPLDQVAADDLEHFRASHQLVVGEVDHAHPAAPQLADDLIVGVVDQLGRQRVDRRGRNDWARGAFGRRCSGRRPTGGRLVRLDPGLLEPSQEIVGRELGNPPLAGIAPFQVLAHRLGRDVVELAQAIGLQDRVGRVDGGGGAHFTISSSGSECRSSINH